MIQKLFDVLPDALMGIHAPIAFAIAGVGLLIALCGARFNRSIIALSLVSAGTVIGLQMPKWFGWGIDPMGTAFGAATVLGLSGYMLTTTWEGILFATLLAAGAGAAVWMDLAPQTAWHLPTLDWSATALEIAARIRLSLPGPLEMVLPVALGIGATVGAMLMVIWPRLGRVLLYVLVGLAMIILGGAIGVRQTAPGWLQQVPTDPWTVVAIVGGLIIFASVVQWLLIKRPSKKNLGPASDNKVAVRRDLVTRVAGRVQSAERGVLVAAPPARAASVGKHQIPSSVR